jgi:hypothetical protein
MNNGNQDKSRTAFEAWWGEPPIELVPLENRTADAALDMWVWSAWQAAEAYGRKQALEDAIAICITPHEHSFTHGFNTSNSFLDNFDIAEKLKELLK